MIFSHPSLVIPQNNFTDYAPIALMFAVSLGFVLLVMLATHLLGPSRKTAVKQETFECGIEVVENARIPFSVKYFVIAILFVLFDVEIIFMYPWAVNFKTLGWPGFLEMILFIVFVLSGFYYVIKKGALKWE